MNTSVPYAALANTFAKIESTTKRLAKNAFLTAFLLLVIERSAQDDHTNLLQAVYLCINRVGLRRVTHCIGPHGLHSYVQIISESNWALEKVC